MRFFGNTDKAIFISRPNRFTILCNLKGKDVKAFLPNPGRLWELLLPGNTVYLEETKKANRKMVCTAVAVQREGHPVMLHTHKTNDVADFLIEKGLVPGLERAEVIRREVKIGRSRLDFLLRKDSMNVYLEVKSCTLFSKRVAMFPDAVTIRGKRHIEELALLSKKSTGGAVLFMVQWPNAEFFLPDYHTDLDFSEALYQAREKIMVIPLSIGWRKDLSLHPDVKLLKIPWKILEREARDRGSYLLILRLPQEITLDIGDSRRMHFRSGYYIYVGSARRNLSKRLDRHRRIRKRLFWHIDYLREVAEFCKALPIRTEDDLECEIANALKKVSEWEVSGFGSSDCICSSHLFGVKTDPLHSVRFHEFLQYYRMERLMKLTRKMQMESL